MSVLGMQREVGVSALPSQPTLSETIQWTLCTDTKPPEDTTLLIQLVEPEEYGYAQHDGKDLAMTFTGRFVDHDSYLNLFFFESYEMSHEEFAGRAWAMQPKGPDREVVQ